MLPGLDTILHGMVDKIVPGLTNMKKGLDGEVVPGLKDLRSGLADQMSPGLRDMLNGFTGKIIPGLNDLKAGVDREVVTNLVTITVALWGDIAGGLTGIKEGIDGQMVPGLDTILEGLEDDFVEGLTKVKSGIDQGAVPVLDSAMGSVDDAVDGVDDMLDGITGTTGLLYLLDELDGGIHTKMLPVLAEADFDPDTYHPATSAILTDLEYFIANYLPHIDPDHQYSAYVFLNNTVAHKVNGLREGINRVDPTYADPGALQLIATVRGGLDNPGYDPGDKNTWGLKQGLTYLKTEITKTAADPEANPDEVGLKQALGLARYGLSKWVGPGPEDFLPDFSWADKDSWGACEALTALLQGLQRTEQLDDEGDVIQPSGVIEGLTKVRFGLSKWIGPGDDDYLPGFSWDDNKTWGASEALFAILHGLQRTEIKVDGTVVQESGVIEGLEKITGGLTGPIGGGLDAILDGLEDEVVPGLQEMKSGVDKQMVPGLNDLVTGLGGDFSIGLYDLLDGFTSTDFAEGYSGIVGRVNTFPVPPSSGGNTGIVDGLSQIRLGLANPEFSPNPGGDPGVSDAMGLMIDGINTEVLGGIEHSSRAA